MSEDVAMADGFVPTVEPSVASAGAVPLALPVAPAGSVVTDAEVPRFWLFWDRVLITIVIIMMMVTAGTAVGLAAVARGAPGNATVGLSLVTTVLLAIPIGILVLIGVPALIQYFRMKRMAKRLAAAATPHDMQSILMEARRARPLMTDKSLLKNLAVALAKEGKTGAAFRLHFPKGRDSVKAIDDPFEPRLLNETDPAFDDLYSATVESSGGNAEDLEAGAVGVAKGIRRNVALKGGIWPRVLLILLFAKEAYFSLQAGQATTGLYLFGAFLAAFFFISPGGGSFLGWYLVPGGVYLRVLNGKVTKREYRLLDRTNSVLVVAQATRDQYWAYVTNGTIYREARFTRRETRLLLGGWTSSAPTPDEARIAQLV